MSVGVVNKQTGERIPTAGMPVIDSVLSGSSTNPVQNRVVKDALDKKADTDIVASDFSTATSYTVDDYCIYEGKFYKFKAAHSGAWAAADVDEIKIAGELTALKSGLSTVENTLDTKVTFTSVGGTDANYRDVTIPSDKNAVFLIVAGGSITSVSTDSIGNVSDIAFASISGDSQKIDDHTVRIWGGSWYRSYSVLKFA